MGSVKVVEDGRLACERMTLSTSASPIVRGAPGRGSSSNPSSRCARNRRRHLPTVGSVISSTAATCLFERPSAASTMRARRARAWAVVGWRVERVSVVRSSVVGVSGQGLASGHGDLLDACSSDESAYLLTRTADSGHQLALRC